MKRDPTYKYLTYLIGPMEYTKDNGLDWRLEYREALKALSIQSIIPNFEETELVKNVADFNALKKTNVNKYKEIMRELIDMDLRFVEEADFLICKWEGERMSGTVGEAQHAHLIGKPVFLITTQPTETIPGWFLACITEIFDSLGCLVLYLKKENRI